MSNKILDACPWITENFILENLRKIESDAEVVLKSFHVCDALGKGENFCSSLIRITANYEVNVNSNLHPSLNKKKSFILKTEIQNEEFEDISINLNLFAREIIAYEKILPRVKQILKAINDDFGDNINFAPVCFASNKEPRYLLLEDLCENAYTTVDRRLGLNYDHVKLSVEKLAKWHAATAFLGITEPELLEFHKIRLMTHEAPTAKSLLMNIYYSICAVSEKWSDFREISDKLKSIEDKVFDKTIETTALNEDQFNVITHGDYWINNLLFKYDEKGQPINLRMVDFALGTWDSSSFDLFYILFSSVDDDIDERQRDSLIRCYHTILKSTLKRLSYPRKIPTLSDIHISLFNPGVYYALFSIFVIVLRHLNKTRGDGFLCWTTDDIEDKEYRTEMFSNPGCEKSLKYLLDYYYRKGYFDI